jgi:hypothetical protein
MGPKSDRKKKKDEVKVEESGNYFININIYIIIYK